MVHFVGAGPGAADLITIRGQRYLQEADRIIYAGSLVNPELLAVKKEGCDVLDSSRMTLEQVIEAIQDAETKGWTTVRLHTGDPCLYGAVREQMDELDRLGIFYDECPGVSSFCAAAASMNLEYTVPGISQSVIITRLAGRTPVPEKEQVRSLAGHGATMVFFLSAGMLRRLSAELIAGGMDADTPAAICYRASWPDEKSLRCTVGTLAGSAEKEGIDHQALVIVGRVAGPGGERSKLYDPEFSTGFRQGIKDTEK